MKLFRLVLLFLLFAPIANSVPSGSAAETPVALRVTQGSSANPGNSKVVYVKDFELEVVRRSADKNSPSGSASDPASGEPAGAASSAPRPPLSSATAGPSSKTSSSPAIASSADSRAENSPAVRANALVNAVSESLVNALEKAGYTVHRQRAGESW